MERSDGSGVPKVRLLDNPWVWFGLLGGVSAIRFLVAASHPLFETECYYWMYGQNVGFGYFDHPPMLGYFIHFLSFWEPPSSLAARFHSVVAHFFCSIFLYYYGRNLFQSTKAGIRTAILFNVIPIYSIFATQNQPDAPLLFFWCATLFCFERSLATGKGWWWILTGIVAGGALLSKFHAAPLVGSLLLHLLFFGKDRKHLATPWPYLAAVIALSCYFPNFWWNAQNDWITYGFQFERLGEVGEFKPVHPLGVFMAPLLLLSPWVYGLLALVAVRVGKQVWKIEDQGKALAFWSSIPLFLLFVYVSLGDSVKIHWTAPAFVGILPAVAVAVGRWTPLKRRAFFGTALAMSGTVYLYFVFPFQLGQMLPTSWLPETLKAEVDERMTRDWASHNFGFDKLGDFLRTEIEEEDPVDFDLIASRRFDRVSVAAFYAGEPDRAFVPAFGDRRGYILWKSPHIKPGANALYVNRDRESEERLEKEFHQLSESFDRVGDPIVVEAPHNGQPFREFLVYPCYGLRDEGLVQMAMREMAATNGL